MPPTPDVTGMNNGRRDERTRSWRRRVVASGGLLVLVAAAFVFAVIARSRGGGVTLVETRVELRGPGERVVTGTLRNNTRGSYERVRVEITLLGQDGDVRGTIRATVLNFDAGETRKFEAQVLADDAVRYRVEKLACSADPNDGSVNEELCAIPAEATGPPYEGDL